MCEYLLECSFVFHLSMLRFRSRSLCIFIGFLSCLGSQLSLSTIFHQLLLRRDFSTLSFLFVRFLSSLISSTSLCNTTPCYTVPYSIIFVGCLIFFPHTRSISFLFPPLFRLSLPSRMTSRHTYRTETRNLPEYFKTLSVVIQKQSLSSLCLHQGVSSGIDTKERHILCGHLITYMQRLEEFLDFGYQITRFLC